MISQEEFFLKYSISKEKFEATELRWEELTQIYHGYKTVMGQLKNAAAPIAETLRDLSNVVHSVKLRIKNPEHLIEKIIRKTIDDKRIINSSNYFTEITDLIGIRVLHLFKDDWSAIHEYIMETWDTYNKQQPVANIRVGDPEEEFEEYGCVIKEHPAHYRSVHYLIEIKPYKQIFVAEIQVRTIFEEAWSEIDHKIRYPYFRDNQMINKYLDTFNKLAGSADDMGLFIKKFKETIENEQKYFSEIETLKRKIEELEIDKEVKSALNYNIEGFKIIEEIGVTASPWCATGQEFLYAMKKSKYYSIYNSIDGLLNKIADFIDNSAGRYKVIAGVMHNFDLKTEDGNVMCRIAVQDNRIVVKNTLQGRSNQTNTKDIYKKVYDKYYQTFDSPQISSIDDVQALLEIVNDFLKV